MLVSAVVNLPELASFCRADDYIAKPFDMEEMTRKMKLFLG
jgi:DNA-binding response OmpR family regulator